jgi:integrase
MANKVKLSDAVLRKLKPQSKKSLIWDTHQRGLALQMQPSGFRSWKCIYSRHGRVRWFHLGAADAISLSDARKLAARVMFKVSEGGDPQAERRAERTRGTFAELAEQYVQQYAKKKNKSWAQAERDVRVYALPRLGNLPANGITRADIKSLMTSIAAPVLANKVVSLLSPIFTWAIREELGVTVNPCSKIIMNETQSRERVLADSEVPRFWTAFDDAGLIAGSALKIILLTGQRPGEVRHMRREHLVDDWWQMPGKADPQTGWPGTKNGNGHRVWLPKAVRDLLADLDNGTNAGFVFHGERGQPITDLTEPMRRICSRLGIADTVRPHDLRRSHGTFITRLGFGRDSMNRIQNHVDGGIASVYDRHSYSNENKKIMEAVAAAIVSLAEGKTASNVVTAKFGR